MTDTEAKTVPVEFLAALGGGKVAYVKAITSDDLGRAYPAHPEIGPGVPLWAVHGADGQPILIADSPEAAAEGAAAADLMTVTLH